MSEAEWIAFLARPEFPAFNRAMLDNPADDLPRLVFADWVEENHPHRRFVKQLRQSVNRLHDVFHCPTFPDLPGVRAGLWRGRLALDFDSQGRGESSVRNADLEFVRVVLNSGWLGRLTLTVSGKEGVVTSPDWIGSVCWSQIEWLQISGSLEWQPAIYHFVLMQPDWFPKLRVLVSRGHFYEHDTRDLHRVFGSPLLAQLDHFDLGAEYYRPEVVEAIRTSPHLTAETKARWGWPTDDAVG